MRPDKVGISSWVFLLSENIEPVDKRIRWGLVYPCPRCREHFAELVTLNLEKVSKLPATDWWLFFRSEISRTDKDAHENTRVLMKNVSFHSYKYIASILFVYEPRVDLAYAKQVKQFLLEWKPEFFESDAVDWSDYQKLWDILDRIYPGQKRRRNSLHRYFSS